MTIKKAELHVHLEGTIPPYLALKLAKRNGMTLPEGLISSDNRSYLYRDFLHFLTVFDTLAAVIKTPQDYYDLTFDYLRANALDDTLYVEMMYSPDHAQQSTGIPSIDNLQAIQQAIDDAENQFHITGRIIITAVRHFGVETVTNVAQQAIKESLPCIVGFGLGGDEANFPPKLFSKAYRIASDGGLACTVHAGEFASADGMLEAIENLPIQRIGHGVQAIHSPDTMALVKDRGIALELCPSSNIALGLFKDLASHPFPAFLDAGIQVSLNSDDPPFMRTTLAEEYRLVQTAYQYSEETMNAITAMAIESSFADTKTKQTLKDRLNNSLSVSI